MEMQRTKEKEPPLGGKEERKAHPTWLGPSLSLADRQVQQSPDPSGRIWEECANLASKAKQSMNE